MHLSCGEKGGQEMGGGKRKPELESQTKRVTQKQRLRETKLKNLHSDTEPGVGAPGAGPRLRCNVSLNTCPSPGLSTE